MKNKLMSLALHPAVLAALIPLTGGCAFHAQGAIRAPRVDVVAYVPPPPTVTVTASAPVVSSTVVASGSRSSSVSVAAPAPVDDGIELGAPESVYAVSVSAAPPPPPTFVLTTPAPRAGYVWVGAHYEWTGARWVWTSGRWIAARSGFTWVQPRYDASRRVYVRGHWETRQLADRDLRPVPSPEVVTAVTPAPAPVVSSTSASSSARVSVGFRAEASIEAGTR